MAAFKGHFSVVRVESVTRMPIHRPLAPHGIRLYPTLPDCEPMMRPTLLFCQPTGVPEGGQYVHCVESNIGFS